MKNYIAFIPVASLALSLFFGEAALAQSDTGPQQSDDQGNAFAVPKSMQDERRPASSGEDDLDLGDVKPKAGRTDTNDTDERPLIPDTARPHPAEAGEAGEEETPGKEIGEPPGLDNEGRRGGSPSVPE